MQFPLDEIDATSLQARRERLMTKTQGEPVLLASGTVRPRNYAANVYPFRAASHFLWTVGLPLRGSFVLLADGEATLFAPMVSTDDVVWHGPVPGSAQLAALAGLPCRSVDDLEKVLAKLQQPVRTLPPPDLNTCRTLSKLLGRAVEPGQIAAGDRRLAEVMIELRLQHDAAAIASLKKAAAITAEVHRAGLRATRPGGNERDVHAAMIGAMAAAGVDPAYIPIISVHGEVLHCDSYGHELKSGDLLLADVGAESHGGWASDVTRTWPVSGKYSTTQKEMYELVLQMQTAAISMVRPGVRYRDVHLAACRALIDGLIALGILQGDAGELLVDGVHGLFFMHGVGHLIGLDVHDMEDLGDLAGYAPGRARSSQFGLNYLRLDRDLQPGMAVTIEPGFYQIPALLDSEERCRVAGDRLNRRVLSRYKDVRGIRIEDDILVTAQGSEVLTAAIPKSVAAIEAALA